MISSGVSTLPSSSSIGMHCIFASLKHSPHNAERCFFTPYHKKHGVEDHTIDATSRGMLNQCVCGVLESCIFNLRSSCSRT